ncbi:MAG: RNA methyltransferase [Clostridia bacterium]|nr:RNA methyltransferase [Clostridia bacterium]
MERITSLKNPRILAWKSLKEPRGRKAHRAFLAEGKRMAEEALRSGFPVRALLLREDCLKDGMDALAAANLPEQPPVFLLPEHVFSAVCDTKTPQGVAAVLDLQPKPLSGNRFLALDGLQDPGNVGTILRTADAAGFDGAILSPDCADVFSPKVLRATMGSIFRVGLSFPESLPERLEALKREGFSVLSSQLDGEPFYARQGVGEKVVLVIGNEGSGVSGPVRAVATHRLRLPMRGGAESLNAAIAAGIMMYELTREDG